jgi:beta-glucanase (GH16 family)
MTTFYLNFDGAKLSLSGGAGATNKASAGNDDLIGDNAGDWFASDNNVDTFVGGSGNDTYSVSNFATQIIEAANGGSDTVQATTNYALPANVEDLVMYGSAIHGVTGVGNNLANLIISMHANQTVNGMGGGDVLIGSSAGSDTFVFQANSGNDIVQSFIAGSGANADTVRIQDYGFYTFSQVQAAMTQSGSNVVLKLDAHDSVTFANTTVSAFTASNFQLALDPSRLHLSFDEEFNSLNLDSGGGAVTDGVWSTQYGFGGYGTLASSFIGNYTGEQQIYIDPSTTGKGASALGLNPFSIANGVLTITGAVTPTADLPALWNKAYYSGLLTSNTSFGQTYGYFEMRAELPSGSGAWPAFWLLPVTKASPIELDILEAAGNNPDYIKMTAHDNSLAGKVTGFGAYVPNATTSFNTYGLLWTAETITWFIDGTAVAQIATPADMNKPMYILLDEALGGDGGALNPASLPNGFSVDYVRAYTVGSSTLVVPVGPASLIGTAGGDTIDGGGGSDTLIYSGARSQYTIYADGAGGYYVETNALGTAPSLLDHLTNIQILEFSDQSATPASLAIGSVLTVAAGSSTLTGTTGNDIIIDSGGGGDTIDGGGGSDTLVYAGTEAQYTLYADGSGGYYVETNALGSGPSLLDHLTNIQTLEFSDQSATPASLTVGSVLTVAAGPTSLTGTSGNDIIIDGGGGGGTINGGGGSDVLVYSGSRSQYTVYAEGSGGAYVETNALGASPSLLDHIVNIQTLQFSDQSAAITSLVGGSVIQAGAGAVTLNGTAGTDILVSGSGADTLNGNGGADVFYVNNSTDVINEAPGSGAIVYLSAGHWSANATAGVTEMVATGAAAINLTGNGYAMTLVANNGIDSLNDFGPADTLIGGTGMDTFIVANVATVIQAASAGTNTIKTSLASYTLPANVQNLTYTGTGAFYGVGGSLAGTLTGGVGNDTLVSGTGAEALRDCFENRLSGDSA